MAWVDTRGAKRSIATQVIQAYFVEHWIQLSLIQLCRRRFLPGKSSDCARTAAPERSEMGTTAVAVIF